MKRNCSHRLQDSEKCESCRRDKWHAWRTDYRCQRPDVVCDGCDTFYPSEKSEATMVFDGFRLVSCSVCYRQREIRKVTARIRDLLNSHIATRANPHPAHQRTIYRDVAIRYLTRFNGNTQTIQTHIDNCEVVLKNRYGSIIGQVSMFDKFPKPPPAESVADMPY